MGAFPQRSLQRVIDSIALLRPQPDAIVVSGDIAENGSKSEYQAFSKILEALDIAVYLLPGNHDDMGLIDSTLNNHLFSSKSPTTIGDWMLMLVNSQVVGASHGFISDNEMQALDAQLSTTAHPVVVAVHHTPVSPCADAGCQLENKHEFLALLQSHTNVKIVLAGHTHQADKSETNGLTIYTAPSTFAQVSHPATREEVISEDFFASHKLDSSRIGFRVFDLHSDGTYEEQLHWLEST